MSEAKWSGVISVLEVDKILEVVKLALPWSERIEMNVKLLPGSVLSRIETMVGTSVDMSRMREEE